MWTILALPQIAAVFNAHATLWPINGKIGDDVPKANVKWTGRKSDRYQGKVYTKKTNCSI